MQYSRECPLYIVAIGAIANIASALLMRAWLSGKNALYDYLVENTVNAANEYAKGKVWSRVIWDLTAAGWLLNDGERFMKDRLIPAPIPEYDHYWGQAPDKSLCRYFYFIRRDALMEDLFANLIL